MAKSEICFFTPFRVGVKKKQMQRNGLMNLEMQTKN
jgi:hypothetical protein